MQGVDRDVDAQEAPLVCGRPRPRSESVHYFVRESEDLVHDVCLEARATFVARKGFGQFQQPTQRRECTGDLVIDAQCVVESMRGRVCAKEEIFELPKRHGANGGSFCNKVCDGVAQPDAQAVEAWRLPARGHEQREEALQRIQCVHHRGLLVAYVPEQASLSILARDGRPHAARVRQLRAQFERAVRGGDRIQEFEQFRRRRIITAWFHNPAKFVGVFEEPDRHFFVGDSSCITQSVTTQMAPWTVRTHSRLRLSRRVLSFCFPIAFLFRLPFSTSLSLNHDDR